jgi:hypothetical protein
MPHERDIWSHRREDSVIPQPLAVALRRCIALDHPSWTLEQIQEAMDEALESRGAYATILADLLASFEV